MRLLLATDGSEYAEYAATWLTHFNFTPRDEVLVLYVVSELPYEDDYASQIRHAIKRVAPRILDSSARILKPLRAKIIPVEQEGYPDTTIVDVAVKNNVDLIVMGARGLRGAKAFLVGSATRNVANNSPKPLLITKPVPRDPGKKMAILFATDGSPSSLATANLLCDLPFPATAELVIINVAWSSGIDIPERFAMEINDSVKQTVAMARAKEIEKSDRIIDEARSVLSKRFHGIGDTKTGGDPATEILAAAQKNNADLIALGSRGLRGIQGVLGSVSRRVLGHAECSVLIGKSG